MSYQIEMLWDCSSCGKQNKGRYKDCQGCGSPKDDSEEFYMPDDISERSAISDPELIRKASAGADWACDYCGRHNSDLEAVQCIDCGSPREKGASAPNDIITASEKLNLDGSVKSRKDSVKKIKDRIRTKRKSFGIATPASSDNFKKTNNKIKKKIRHKINWKIAAPIAGGLAIIGFLCWFLFVPKELDVAVSSVHWSHTVSVERYLVVSEEGFDVPNDAMKTKSIGSRHHHYKSVQDGFKTEAYTDTYVCGQNCTTTPKICTGGTRHCTSGKNGFANCYTTPRSCTGGNTVCSPKTCTRTKHRQVPKYKQVSVERMYYSWKAWRWRHNRNVVSSGNSVETHWPTKAKIALNKEVTGGQKERQIKKAEYSVIFIDDEEEKYDYEPKTLEEFIKFKVGSNHRIKYSRAAGIEVLNE